MFKFPSGFQIAVIYFFIFLFVFVLTASFLGFPVFILQVTGQPTIDYQQYQLNQCHNELSEKCPSCPICRADADENRSFNISFTGSCLELTWLYLPDGYTKTSRKMKNRRDKNERKQ